MKKRRLATFDDNGAGEMKKLVEEHRSKYGIVPISLPMLRTAIPKEEDVFVINGKECCMISIVGTFSIDSSLLYLTDTSGNKVQVLVETEEVPDGCVKVICTIVDAGKIKAINIEPVETDFAEYFSLYIKKAHSDTKSQGGPRDKILQVLKEMSKDNEVGVTVEELAKKCNLPLSTVKGACNYFEDEGHLYSTIDDRIKATDC